MPTLTDEQIKEIAEELDCGFRSFYHPKTGELLFVPDTLRYPDIDIDAWEEDLEKLENNFTDYKEIKAMKSDDSFQIMADFAQQFDPDESIQRQLISALKTAKPFREFKFVIDNSDYRQQWFDFKNSSLKEWVMAQIKNI